MYGNAIKALTAYENVNHELPEKILVFRDGIGDGNIEWCKEIEISRLKQAFKVFEDYNPKLTYVIVSKRINARYSCGQLQGISLKTVESNLALREGRTDFLESLGIL